MGTPPQALWSAPGKIWKIEIKFPVLYLYGLPKREPWNSDRKAAMKVRWDFFPLYSFKHCMAYKCHLKIHWNNVKCIACTAAGCSFGKELQDVFFTIRCLLHKLKSDCFITLDRTWELSGHNNPMRITITIATLHFDLLLFCWISQPGSQSCGYYGRLKQKFTFLGQGR